MKKPWILAGLLGLAACGGGSDNPLDIPDKIRTLEQCLPGTFGKAEVVLDLVELWKLQATPPADPAGLTWSENGNGELEVEYVVDACTLTMTISFHTSDGTRQDLDLTGTTSLAEAIAAAADALRDLDAGNGPFLLGAWTASAPGAGGSGAITAVIGGTANQNELERLKTTTAFPAGGEPPVQASTITTDDGCELSFRFSDLQTDTVVPQAYPIGTVDITLTGPDATATGTITFNNTVNAVADVNGVPGDFLINLDTGAVTYRAP